MPEASELVQSESVENFLKAVYTLQQTMERVSTNALAEMLGVQPPSITDMARRMENAGLVQYQKYQGVRLTPQGEEIALKVIRRHRLIELYLVRELGYALREVHEEAENLEHAVSDRFVEALARKMGNPQLDPHGDPIPSPDGTIANRNLIPLTELALHVPAAVSRFISADAEMLQHMLDRGFTLDSLVEVVARDPFDGPLTVLVSGSERVVGHTVASAILVEPLEKSS